MPARTLKKNHGYQESINSPSTSNRYHKTKCNNDQELINNCSAISICGHKRKCSFVNNITNNEFQKRLRTELNEEKEIVTNIIL